MASASARVAGSGIVGPDATSAGSSPGMSEMTSECDPRRVGRRGEPAALDPRQMLAQAVHLADRRAGSKKQAIDRALRLAADASGGSDSRDEPPPEISATT